MDNNLEARMEFLMQSTESLHQDAREQHQLIAELRGSIGDALVLAKEATALGRQNAESIQKLQEHSLTLTNALIALVEKSGEQEKRVTNLESRQ